LLLLAQALLLVLVLLLLPLVPLLAYCRMLQ
jgi:hypothetical protein